jgi:serine/threonine-protein kinase
MSATATRFGLLGGCVLGGVLFTLGTFLTDVRGQPDKGPELPARVRAIFEKNCAECHGEKKPRKKLNVFDTASLLSRTRNPPVVAVVPGKPDESELIKQVQSGDMPQGGDKLADDDVKTLRDWVTGLSPAIVPAVAVARTKAEVVQDLLQSRCATCHGGSKPTAGLDVLNHEDLVKKAVNKQEVAESLLLKKVRPETPDRRAMPPPGEGRKRLSPEEVAAIEAWIKDGAPAFDFIEVVRAGNPDQVDIQPATKTLKKVGPNRVGNDYVLRAILKDVRAQGSPGNGYRYFSLNHLLAAGVSARQLESHRKALLLAVNHLSWSGKPQPLTPIEETGTVYRVDVGKLGWDDQPFERLDEKSAARKVLGNSPLTLWDLVLLEYPYGVMTDAQTYQDLVREYLQPTGQAVPIPYIRGDWFVNVALRPPLYEDMLQLPYELSRLERLLGVDPEAATKGAAGKGTAQRAGMTASGVSRNNRVVEHSTPRGGLARDYFWRSYDFRSSKGTDNMFRNPIDLSPSGGEMIWGLPNGLQGYYVCDAAGKRIDAAPTEIVTDEFASDKIVRNGFSCIRCHESGMRRFQDDVRPAFDKLQPNGFTATQIRNLYPPHKRMDEILDENSESFGDALAKLFGEKETTAAVVGVVSDRYQDRKVSGRSAGAELGSSDPDDLVPLFRSDKSMTLGLPQLAFNGAIARDAWEDHFDQVVANLGQGKAILPLDGETRSDYQPEGADFEIDIRMNKPPANAEGKLQITVENQAKRNILAAGDKVQIVAKNNTSKKVFLEVNLHGLQGNKMIVAPGKVALNPGQEVRLPDKATLTVSGQTGTEQVVVFASQRDFQAGQWLVGSQGRRNAGKDLGDRIVHAFYDLDLTNNGVQLKFNPSRVVKRSFGIETR